MANQSRSTSPSIAIGGDMWALTFDMSGGRSRHSLLEDVRSIHFLGKRHPQELGANEVGDFLTHLAVERHVASSTQTQARSALRFPHDAQVPA